MRVWGGGVGGGGGGGGGEECYLHLHGNTFYQSRSEKRNMEWQ